MVTFSKIYSYLIYSLWLLFYSLRLPAFHVKALSVWFAHVVAGLAGWAPAQLNLLLVVQGGLSKRKSLKSSKNYKDTTKPIDIYRIKLSIVKLFSFYNFIYVYIFYGVWMITTCAKGSRQKRVLYLAAPSPLALPPPKLVSTRTFFLFKYSSTFATFLLYQ